MPEPENTNQSKEAQQQASPDISGSFIPPSGESIKVEDAAASSQIESPPNKETGVTEVKPVEQSSEKKMTASLDDFVKELSGELPTTPAPKKEEGVQSQQQQLPLKIEERDFTGIEEKDIPLFKKMSNDAFNTLKPMYVERHTIKKENEELKKKTGAFPESYYQHERAYMLSPEYTQLEDVISVTDAIRQHWEQQLINVEAGKDWQDLDIKDGKYVLSEPQAAGPEAKILIQKAMGFSERNLERFIDKRNDIKTSFKTSYEEQVGQINSYINTYFKEYQDEKHPMRPVITKVLEKFPPAFRNTPPAILAANAIAWGVQLTRILDDVNSKKNGEQVRKADEKAAGPNLNNINQVEVKKGPKIASLEDFERELA